MYKRIRRWTKSSFYTHCHNTWEVVCLTEFFVFWTAIRDVPHREDVRWLSSMVERPSMDSVIRGTWRHFSRRRIAPRSQECPPLAPSDFAKEQAQLCAHDFGGTTCGWRSPQTEIGGKNFARSPSRWQRRFDLTTSNLRCCRAIVLCATQAWSWSMINQADIGALMSGRSCRSADRHQLQSWDEATPWASFDLCDSASQCIEGGESRAQVQFWVWSPFHSGGFSHS